MLERLTFNFGSVPVLLTAAVKDLEYLVVKSFVFIDIKIPQPLGQQHLFGDINRTLNCLSIGIRLSFQT